MHEPESPVGKAQQSDAGAGVDRMVSIVTVTYNPDIAVLARQLAQMPPDTLKILVDNASSPGLAAEIRRLATQPNTHLIENPRNLGLAAALNQGASAAKVQAPGLSLLLFLDQDTEPGEHGVERLVETYLCLSKTHPKLGCIGPKMVDHSTGLQHGFHQIAGWRWVRRYPQSGEPCPVSNINGSGMLVSRRVFEHVGGFRESFFIDHVDTDFSFRVLASGSELFGVPDIEFIHRMGESTICFWFFGWKAWPYRSAARHYFLFRNTTTLMRMASVPLVWKVWAPVKLLLTLGVHLAFDGQRFQQARQMLRGLLSGLSTEKNAVSNGR